MANGEQNFGFDQLFPAGLPETPTGGFRPLFEPVQKAQQVAEASERAQRTLIDKLGFEADSPIGGALNIGASVVSGASRVAGNLATLPLDAISGMAQASISEDAVQAYNRTQRGEATPEDLAILQQVAPGDDGIPQTYAQRIEGTIGLQKAGTAVADFFDLSSIVDQTDRERL
ncbi:MAG: hypothetical protein J6N20_05975, partial [Pseudomonas sp.]|nr:hypothetical protein [Pseudomonas sp.]